jgi:RNA 2',3'-cyclic 3'-phosphodiesterase
MRTFLALELSDSYRTKLTSLISKLKIFDNKNIKWVTPENLHITLQFIGETKESDLTDFCTFLDESYKNKAKLLFASKKLDIVPNRDPKVIWIEMQNNDSWIINSHKKFKSFLNHKGYKINKKSLRFHITLGRIKKKIDSNLVNQILSEQIELPNFSVENITLIKSTLRPQGPIYETIANFNLKGDNNGKK